MCNREGDYIGDFKMNEREGKGTMIYKLESEGTYDGEWKNGKKHGKGVLTINDKTIKGEWVEGKKV